MLSSNHHPPSTSRHVMSHTIKVVPQLPAEVVGNIVEQGAEDRHFLCQALEVNKVWADAAQRVLWRRPQSAFLSSLARSRRQDLANKIRCLSFHQHSTVAEVKVYDKLSLPNFRALELEKVQIGYQRFVKFVQAGLREMKLVLGGGASPRQSILSLIQDRCPHLQKLVIRSDGRLSPNWGAQAGVALAFQNLLFGCSELRHIEVGSFIARHFDSSIFRQIFLREGLDLLEELYLPDLLLHEAVLSNIAPLPGQFPHVMEISLACNSATAATMISKMPNVRRLTLHILDGGKDFLPGLAHLTDVKDLKHEFQHTLTLSPTSDAEQVAFFSGFTKLKELVFMFQGQLSVPAMFALARGSSDLGGFAICSYADFYGINPANLHDNPPLYALVTRNIDVLHGPCSTHA
ncbi:hypothetical protein K461DRAFT_302432 [Myriangium duriaei CBS 260.36]|uniref:F-box domain-containing protein n=1 Tax=Myriangium duriaei CBS 260.36 TaxID=1168546 RepID=A0A9P4IWH9_9PEZI|nr:hypothetical protein K461DRAFT_302432 [Myriangium duriaei CBS 260.36]